MIEVERLSKTYRVPIKQPGLAGSLRSLWRRETKDVHAVRDLSFRIEPGERVGFLGPNGAGKTTTLKMLSGLLHPTGGAVRVRGHRPQDRDPAFLSAITLVMGQKQQLLWDLPPRESLELNRALFGVPRAEYQRTLDELVDMLDLAPILDKPTRNLSLGERMKCELAAALVHRPSVLFLDEPTIGLDVTMQVQVRRFIKQCNERMGATVLLTSHYMADIAALTPRVLIIDQGQLRYDGKLDLLSRQFAPERRVAVRGEHPALRELGFSLDEDRMVASAPVSEVNALIQRVLALLPMADLSVEEPPLEEVMSRVFKAEASP